MQQDQLQVLLDRNPKMLNSFPQKEALAQGKKRKRMLLMQTIKSRSKHPQIAQYQSISPSHSLQEHHQLFQKTLKRQYWPFQILLCPLHHSQRSDHHECRDHQNPHQTRPQIQQLHRICALGSHHGKKVDFQQKMERLQ